MYHLFTTTFLGNASHLHSFGSGFVVYLAFSSGSGFAAYLLTSLLRNRGAAMLLHALIIERMQRTSGTDSKISSFNGSPYFTSIVAIHYLPPFLSLRASLLMEDFFLLPCFSAYCCLCLSLVTGVIQQYHEIKSSNSFSTQALKSVR